MCDQNNLKTNLLQTSNLKHPWCNLDFFYHKVKIRELHEMINQSDNKEKHVFNLVKLHEITMNPLHLAAKYCHPKTIFILNM